MGADRTFTLRLPLSLKKAAEHSAREGGSTLNQFIVTALAEKLAAPKTADYFTSRASCGDLAAFDRFMSRRDGAAPRPEDRWDDVDATTSTIEGGSSGPGRD